MENNFAKVSFLKKFMVSNLQLYQTETLPRVYFCEFCKILKSNYFKERLQTAASKNRKLFTHSQYYISTDLPQPNGTSRKQKGNSRQVKENIAERKTFEAVVCKEVISRQQILSSFLFRLHRAVYKKQQRSLIY